MDKSCKEKRTPEETEKLNKWYDHMMRNMEWDAHFHDFTVDSNWEKDFHESMRKGFEKLERKKKMQRCAVCVAVCLVIGVLCVGVIYREVITEFLREVFVNVKKGIDGRWNIKICNIHLSQFMIGIRGF